LQNPVQMSCYKLTSTTVQELTFGPLLVFPNSKVEFISLNH